MQALSHISKLSFIAMLWGCGSYVPPEPPQPHVATTVKASAGKTWDAVIELFADRSIPIRNMERASGFIATEELSVASGEGATYADCGTPPSGMNYDANRVGYNVLVRGDSASSTVKVTAHFRFVHPGGLMVLECSTRNLWETAFEQVVAARAEGRQVPAAVNAVGGYNPCAARDTAERSGDDYVVTTYIVGGQDCVPGLQCHLRDGAVTMKKETAIARCRADAKRE